MWTALGLAPEAPGWLWERFLRRDLSLAAVQIVALVVLAAFAKRHGLHEVSCDARRVPESGRPSRRRRAEPP